MPEYSGKQSRTQSTSSMAHAAESSPGKRTLVEQTYPAMVQRRASASQGAGQSPATAMTAAAPHGDRVQRMFGRPDMRAADSTGPAAVVQRRASGPATEEVHAAAARGLESPATSLPFAGQIQAAFGPDHDVSSIQAHVGGSAEAASRAMGATAYATGNHTVFATAPDLHTAAHEAAHVVQQREGVQLSGGGGVGQAGDSYERHADAVADRVVQGQSAADLLGQHAHAASDPGQGDQVQHKCNGCGGAVSGAGECTTCKDKANPKPTISTGGSQLVQRNPDPTKSQDSAAPANQDNGAGAGAQPAASGASQFASTWGWGGDATRNVYAPCNVVEMDRAGFLAFEATALAQGGKRSSLAQAKGGFGITTSTVSNAKPPPIEAEAFQDGGRTKFRLKPTHAEMAAIQSAVTSAGEFVEGVFHWGSQDPNGCPSGNYPIRWVLLPDGLAKVKQGEQEHCNDFRSAFDNTHVLYASVINNVAAANRVYDTEKAAIGDALSSLGMAQPGEMMASYSAAAARTLSRDKSAHIPHIARQQPDPGCREVRTVLGAGSWQGVPGPASDDVVNPPAKP